MKQTDIALSAGKRRLFRGIVYSPLLLAGVVLSRQLGIVRHRVIGEGEPKPMYGIYYLTGGSVQRPFETNDCGYLTRDYGAKYPFDFCLREYHNGEVSISDGVFTDHDITQPKPIDVFRVGCFGGSVTEGYVGRERIDSWPKRLNRILNESGVSYQVINYGQRGESSGPQLWRFHHMAAHHQLDVAILYIGENDITKCRLFEDDTEQRLAEYMFTGDRSHLEAIHPWFLRNEQYWAGLRKKKFETLKEFARGHFPKLEMGFHQRQTEFDFVDEMYRKSLRPKTEQDLEKILTTTKQEEIDQSPFNTLPPSLIEEGLLVRNLEAMIEEGQERGTKVIVAHTPFAAICRQTPAPICYTYPVLVADLEAYNNKLGNALSRVSGQYGVPFVDFSALLTPDCGNFVDSVHLTMQGLSTVAKTLAPMVRELAGKP